MHFLLRVAATANVNTLQYLGTFSREQNRAKLSTDHEVVVLPFTRVVLPQRFYLGNLNEVLGSGNALNIRQYFGLRSTAPMERTRVRTRFVGNTSATRVLLAPRPCQLFLCSPQRPHHARFFSVY